MPRLAVTAGVDRAPSDVAEDSRFQAFLRFSGAVRGLGMDVGWRQKSAGRPATASPPRRLGAGVDADGDGKTGQRGGGGTFYFVMLTGSWWTVKVTGFGGSTQQRGWMALLQAA